MIPPRAPAVAGLFYPSDAAACEEEIRRCRAAAPASPLPPGTAVHAVVAPHAGWSYSGALAAAALAPLGAIDPDTVVLFGADHHGLSRAATVYPGPAWGTPLGPVEVDREAVAALLDAAPGVEPSVESHAPEHSLEVLVPFLRVLVPRARIVAVIVPPGCGAAAVGAAARAACDGLGRRSAAVGSTDLTHYGARFGFEPRGRGPGAHRWSREENDGAVLARAVALDAEGLLRSARERHNACGPGATAAAVSFARAAGAVRGILLAHATSAEVMGERSPDPWVGYAALALVS